MPFLPACLFVAVLAAPPTPPPMPITGLAPSKLVADLCLYRYRVSTASPDCQAHCDQGFGYYYSYVWMEAARSFETALQHDPDCAIAWLGLHRALDKWGKGGTPLTTPFLALAGAAWQAKLPARVTKPVKDFTLDRAQELMLKASDREQFLIRAKLQEKGLLPGVGPDERKKKAAQTLDELLTLYEDDEEGWFARAQVAEGQHGAAPFYKALLRINPVNPGANHELVHFYENIRRPALGWANAEGYVKSSPGIPHAFHMQAHLGMRIGKWQQTTDWSKRAIELQREYHRVLDVKPGDDHQFVHHLEILTRSLIHDGRFAEAKAIKKESEDHKYYFRPEWFRMATAQKDWTEARKTVDFFRKSDKGTAAYYSARLALDRGDTAGATSEVDTLRQMAQSKKTDRRLEQRLWETQGRLLCQTGQGEAGVKLLRRAVDKTKNDYAAHAWAGGAYYMEVWGIAALEAGLVADAEEAFQEALAHDAGSVRGALGMSVLCRRLGRNDEADRYMKVAKRCWAKAEPADFERLRDDLAAKASAISTASVAAR